MIFLLFTYVKFFLKLLNDVTIIADMKKSLVIFDMDGTILNTLEDLTDSTNYILNKYNKNTRSIEEVRMFVGNGIRKLVERAFGEDTEKTIIDCALKDFLEYYEEHSAIKTRPYDNIIEVLKKLKEQGFKIAVNTNKVEEAAIVLCDNYFTGIFDYISGNREGLPPKPAPDGIYEILEKAKVTKEEAIFIGDSDVDLQTGFNAGLEVIGVDWGFRGIEFLKQKGAKHVVLTPFELYEKILELSI